LVVLDLPGGRIQLDRDRPWGIADSDVLSSVVVGAAGVVTSAGAGRLTWPRSANSGLHLRDDAVKVLEAT
jgi:hypothetical protein